MRHNRKGYLPRRVLYFDTETKKRTVEDEEHHRLRLAWVCYINKRKKAEYHKEQWSYFNKTYDLCRYIDERVSEHDPLYVFAHNIYFDLQACDFFHFFRQWGYELSFYYDKSLTYILILRKGKARLKLLSSTNFLPTSLKGLGELVGLPKQTVDFDTATDEELSAYCRNDVEILKRSMEYYFSFIRDNDLGSFGLSRASQAMKAYRHKYMYKKISIHCEKDVREIERSAYFGGRTECFRFGEQSMDDYLLLDVNSMYPYVMKNYPVPTRTLDVSKRPRLEVLPAILKNYGAIAQVVLKTDVPAYAVRYNGKVVFPTGEFETSLCTEGLKYALQNGHIVKLKSIVTYDMDVIFSAYVDEFYALKLHYQKTGQHLMREVSKVFMNSLYGKFAQKGTVDEKVYEPKGKGFYKIETYCLDTGERFLEYKMFNTRVIEYGTQELSKSFVAIPAHITEYSRFLLWRIIQDIGRDKVYYCDTDSIVIRKADLPLLSYRQDRFELGALSIKQEFRKLVLNGCKHYIMGDKKKIKGIPKNAVEIAPYVYKYKEWLRQANHMRKEITRFYILKDMIKDVTPQYDKGIVNTDGTICPLTLSPLDPLS